jgi:hypothetical protein
MSAFDYHAVKEIQWHCVGFYSAYFGALESRSVPIIPEDPRRYEMFAEHICDFGGAALC